jgi:hypothetical protein
MKIQRLVTLCWIALSSALYTKRDLPNDKQFDQAIKVLERVAPNVKPIAITLKPQLRPNAIRKQLRFGPNIIPASKAVRPLLCKISSDIVNNLVQGVTFTEGGMGHSSAPLNSTTPKNWADMTISQAIGSLTGTSPPMGLFGVTVGQIWKFFSGIFTGDYVEPLKEIMKATQDPNGWSLQRTFKAKDLCQGCTVISTKADVVFENGTRADISKGIYLHHTATINMGMHTNVNWLSQCTASQTTFNGINFQDYLPRELVGPIQLLALGNVDEFTQYYTSKDGGTNGGLHVNEDDTLFVMTEAVNYANFDQKIYIQLDVEYVNGTTEKETTYTPLTFTGKSINAHTRALGYSH